MASGLDYSDRAISTLLFRLQSLKLMPSLVEMCSVGMHTCFPLRPSSAHVSHDTGLGPGVGLHAESSTRSFYWPLSSPNSEFGPAW